jgi:regulator of cell morphogenesis and NO signaling
MRRHSRSGEGSGERTLASALEREHREIDRTVEAHLATRREGQGRTEHLREAMAALRRHIYLEEEFLFPPLRAAGLVAPIFVMLREHGELWRTMGSIERGLSGEKTGAEVPACEQLLAQLERHNSKEEPILYPRADEVLGGRASAELRAFIEGGRMPPGWACANA